MTAAPVASPPRRRRWVAVGALVLGLVAAFVLLAAFFPWDTLREPVNRYVSEKTGRKFEITRHLDVSLGWRQATVKIDGIEFANPAWARDPYLVRADKAEFDIRFWELLRRRIVLPRLMLSGPSLGLEMEADGRKTWALGKDSADPGTIPVIGLIQVDGGSVDFLAQAQALDLHADFSFDSSRGDLPLDYQIKGRYRGQPMSAVGRTGNVLQLTSVGQPPFPIEIDLKVAQTRLKGKGTVAELADLDGLDAQIEMRGPNLGRLYPALGIALPQTPPYALSGNLRKNGALWEVRGLKGRLGLSDIGGDMQFDKSQQVPHLGGTLRSRVMDMDDLGPLIGLPPTARSANAVEGVAAPPSIAQLDKRKRDDPARKVLPDASLDFERLRAMNADVSYTAERIQNVRELPLDKGSVQVKLKDGVLTLDPLDLGVASGRIAGAIRIDATQNPADIRAALDIRGMQLNRLIPKVETLKTSFGKLDGRINLSGRGNSVAAWLANSSGDVAGLTGRGQFSNLLLEFLGLDGGEIIKFLLEGDHNVELRCAAVAFDVEKGVMTGRTLLFDTSDTVFNGTGSINLADERMDLSVKQEPKDKSILALRTPLRVRGTFAAPKAGVEVAPLAARGAAALALAAINPLLALAATVETGPGKDADCTEVLAEAKTPSSRAAKAGAAKAKQQPTPASGS
ncbi:AsmA family protein [Variovorax sp. J22P271]|uniref:AsmA family protein n=1 Tax=Variovorax davisae TaxID=3053515 RepID=UPI002575E90B|nr:AsmA family protein [Variovorax sp. J22P271]MDM0031744.1 AsmA family protein [Variovorax sp. J22P271]